MKTIVFSKDPNFEPLVLNRPHVHKRRFVVDLDDPDLPKLLWDKYDIRSMPYEEQMMFKPCFIKSAEYAYKYASEILKDRFPEAEECIAKNIQFATPYAIYILRKRWPEAEKYAVENYNENNIFSIIQYIIDMHMGRWPDFEEMLIRKRYEYSITRYATGILKCRWPEAEHLICYNAYVCDYASVCIKGRWFEREKDIGIDPYYSIMYAADVIKGRWPEIEPRILDTQSRIMHYIIDAIKGPWSEAEPIILKDAYNSFEYSKKAMKRRWLEAEPYIAAKNKSVWRNYKLLYEIKKGWHETNIRKTKRKEIIMKEAAKLI